jgi:hypothetical protein
MTVWSKVVRCNTANLAYQHLIRSTGLVNTSCNYSAWLNILNAGAVRRLSHERGERNEQDLLWKDVKGAIGAKPCSKDIQRAAQRLNPFVLEQLTPTMKKFTLCDKVAVIAGLVLILISILSMLIQSPVGHGALERIWLKPLLKLVFRELQFLIT